MTGKNLLAEPTDLDIAIMERASMGVCPFGPLTRDDTDHIAAYEAYCAERDAEYEREQAAGGKTRCPSCDEFAVNHIPVSNGIEPSTFYRCDNCGWEDFAG